MNTTAQVLADEYVSIAKKAWEKHISYERALTEHDSLAVCNIACVLLRGFLKTGKTIWDIE